jgi:hypothetical protein
VVENRFVYVFILGYSTPQRIRFITLIQGVLAYDPSSGPREAWVATTSRCRRSLRAWLALIVPSLCPSTDRTGS